MRMPFVSGIGYVWRPSDRFRNIPQVRGGQRESLRVAREILVGQGKCLCSWDNGQGFFFLPVPCALEAQTVINTSCFDWRFPRIFFFWMLHGSTKVVVRAVAPLSANTNHKVAMSLGK